MTTKASLEQLILCLIQVIGRTAMPSDNVREIVGRGSGNVKAFNMCDGSRTQSEIARKLRMDGGNFSRTVRRWIEAGVVFDIGSENESRILHIYPLQSRESAPTSRGKRGK